MKRVALTGGIATGKSHILKHFEQLGVPTIDADVLAREAVAPGSDGLDAVVRSFGADVLDSSGALDRRKLATIVFNDPERRVTLEHIVHPEVRRRMDAWFRTVAPGVPFAIADIPLLYETGREAEFDAVIVAAADPETQVRRMVERDALSETDAKQRLAAQLPIQDKERRADYVIRTAGSFVETERQVEDVFHALTADVID